MLPSFFRRRGKKIGALFFYFAGGDFFSVFMYMLCVTWKRHGDWAMGTSPITGYGEWRI